MKFDLIFEEQNLKTLLKKTGYQPEKQNKTMVEHATNILHPHSIICDIKRMPS